MSKQVRAAGMAALVIFLAFAVHASNLFYFEPRMGFARPGDYASIPKLAVGLRSASWLWSGYAHFATGLALVALAGVGSRLFESSRPLGSRLGLATGVLAGWFILHFNWCLRRTRRVGFLLGLLGYAAGLAGFGAFLWPGGYGLAYLLLPAWALWIGVEFIAGSAHVAAPEET
jgi:hypothetical protein